MYNVHRKLRNSIKSRLCTQKIKQMYKIKVIYINKTERTLSPKPPDKTRNAKNMLEHVSKNHQNWTSRREVIKNAIKMLEMLEMLEKCQKCQKYARTSKLELPMNFNAIFKNVKIIKIGLLEAKL